MSNTIQFRINRPIDKFDLENLDALDREIEARVALRSQIAEDILDQLASGQVYAGVRRDVVMTGRVARERLIIGSTVRYKRVNDPAARALGSPVVKAPQQQSRNAQDKVKPKSNVVCFRLPEPPSAGGVNE